MNLFGNGKVVFLLMLLPLISFANEELFGRLQNAADSKALHKSHIWHSLLHLDKDKKPSINTPQFLLSYDDFSPKKELDATIKSFLNDKKAICKYPARFSWLNSELDLGISADLAECSEFNEYIQKTNPIDLKLVFASEQVESPSSMMGHIFFKLEGVGKDGYKRENAISFFTVIDTLNLPYLAVQSTLLGMKGYFVLSPYRAQIERYLNIEDRSIWEYELNLTEYQKKLIYYHFWELKGIDITYFFTGFNCATIVDDMLSISNPEYKDGFYFWVSPKDVVKRANANNLIKSTKMIPSLGWNIRMLSESLDGSEVKNIKKAVDNSKVESIENKKYENGSQKEQLRDSLLLSYAKHAKQRGSIFSNELAEKLSKIAQSKKPYELDISGYKNPIKSPKSTQIRVGIRGGDHGGVELGFLPASHNLYDDNRQYFGESALKIGEISLLAKKSGDVELEKIDFFSMSSLSPWDTLTNPISKEFALNFEKHYDKKLDAHKMLNINVAVGASKRLSEDVLVYGLFGIGAATNIDNSYLYAYPKLGLIIYEVFDMKTLMELRQTYPSSFASRQEHLSIVQSIFTDKNLNINFKYEFIKNAEADKSTGTLSFVYLF